MMSSVPEPGTRQWFLDPSPWFSAMRHSAPVYYDENSGLWHVFRYSDVELVLKQFSIFSSQFGGYDLERESGAAGSASENGKSQAGGNILSSMLTTDPPLHTKLRNIVSKSFTPSSVGALEPRIVEIADEFLDHIHLEKEVDIVSEYAEPLPITVIAEMLGIPVEDRRKFKEWSDSIVGISENRDIENSMRTNRELGSYFGRIIDERRRNPGKDLISAIVTSEVDGERLSLSEAVSFCILLLVAGNETTTNLIGNAARLFARYEDSFQKLQNDKSLLQSAIEEVLRFSSPVRGMFRVTVSETEISGKRVLPGQSLMAWIGSANRDETRFPEPNLFDIERKPNPHIAFGHGIHTCLGAPLARLEGKVALGSLIEKFAGAKIEVQDDQIEPITNMVIGGVKHLPIRFVE